MSVDEGAARRLAGMIAAQDEQLARDLAVAVQEHLASWGDPETLDPGTEEQPTLLRLRAFAVGLGEQLPGPD